LKGREGGKEGGRERKRHERRRPEGFSLLCTNYFCRRRSVLPARCGFPVVNDRGGPVRKKGYFLPP
jgi:hypothetical protein